ncbi:aspartyl protease family protein At5g10770-like [Oryza brachyantha]|uniref:Peptidase A1 domain-containing protein n=1 Tax=Oryza brachyantha TaxID=4533 RepID=J3LGJ6_ORYBR|nr:aspartyl protease family protein At5g10770-like [Oryza brachyantha]
MSLPRKQETAMASVSTVLVLLLLCSCCHSLVAHAGNGERHKVLELNSKAVCSERNAIPSSSGGTTVPLNHRHGPCSPVPSGKKRPTHEELLKRDQLRAEHIQRKFSRNAAAVDGAGELQQSKASVPTKLGSSLDTLEYVISVKLGSPGVTQTVSIDTGSDVSWVQCNPCPAPPCHAQADPLFDPAASSTYAAFSCGAAECAQLEQQGNGCGANSECQYGVQYGDGSTTNGTYSHDTLTLSGADVVKSFQFGCSHTESGFSDQTDGLMGLGGGAQSLVSQTAAKYGNSFSYCLPPTSDSSGFLTLGGPSGGASGFVTTRMLRSRRVPTFYGARLQDIAVGGKQLGLPPSVFAAGSVVDSGTIITRLPQTAYSALSSAFRAGMKQYRSAPPRSILDTCFDFTGQTNISIPTVELVFSGGATVDLDANGIMFGSCLAFTSTGDDRTTGIIGNVQQRTFEVLYDVGNSVLGFRSGAC